MNQQLKNFFLSTNVILGLSGCMVGPEYSRPCLPIQKNWVNTILCDDSNCLFEDPVWWHVFQNASLDELIDYAYLQNRDLEISGIQVYQAYASLGISIGEFFPQFQQFQASHSYRELSKNTANVPLDTNFHNYFVNFLASWEIDLWGKFRHGILASQANLMGAVFNYRDVLRSLVGNIAQIYMQILGFNIKIELLQENVAYQERTLRIVKTKQRLGETSGLDVQQAISVLENTRAILETQVLQKELAENFLCTLLGVAPFDISDCFDLEAPIPELHVCPEVGIPFDLVRSRPDVRAAEQAAIAQANVVGIAETDLLPSFTLSGFFGWESEKMNRLFQSDGRTSGYSQDIAWNIFNYGRLTNNVRLQNAILQELMTSYQNTVINACREVEDAIVSFQQNKAIVQDLESTVEATARSLNLSLTQYRYGAVEFLNVLTAETNLVQQQLSLVDAQVACVNSFISIETSLGKGWEFKENEDFISPCTKKQMDNRIWWNKYFW